MSRIIVFTMAYNAERTLSRAIESVLCQTYGDFLYFICDNGSTDKTGQIISDYARYDQRITPLSNEINGIGINTHKAIQHFSHEYSDSDFFCTLDADDEYCLDYFYSMLCFIKEYELEIAACGSNFVDASTGTLLGIRKINADLIIDGDNFEEDFPVYHQFMRTTWGKLFSLSILKKCTFDYVPLVSYGADTLMTMEAFSHARRVGVLAQSLHKYYVSSKTYSYRLDDKRVHSDIVLHNCAQDYLRVRAGYVSKQNESFLYFIYMNAISDTLRVLCHAEETTINILENMREIFSRQVTINMLRCNAIPDDEINQKIRQPVTKWILAQKECRKSVGAKKAIEIFFAIHPLLSQIITSDGLEFLLLKMPEIIDVLLKQEYGLVLQRVQIWYKRHDEDIPALANLEIALYVALSKTNKELFTLLTDIRKKRPYCSEELNIDIQIYELLAQHPMLVNISASLASSLSQVVSFVLEENFQKALDAFIVVSPDLEIADNDMESYIMLAQNLSAASNHTDAYIYFKKMWIAYLIECSRKDEAQKVLDEFKRILPDDEDFTVLEEKLR